MDPITIGATAVGLGSKMFSAIKGGGANDATQNLINQQIKDNEAYYNNRVNRDFMETNVAKGLVEQMRKNLDKNNKVIKSNAAVTGGTAEAAIAEKAKNQEKFNEGMNQIASGATQYQQAAEGQFNQTKNNLVNAQVQLNKQKADSASNLASNASELIKGAATLTGFEDIANKEPVLG